MHDQHKLIVLKYIVDKLIGIDNLYFSHIGGLGQVGAMKQR